MRAIEGRMGRVFVLRLDHDDPLPKSIEDFAAEKQIQLAQVVFIGGIYNGNLVTGPRVTAAPRPEPIVLPVDGAADAVATGLIARGENGNPVLHMHGALGRSGQTITGCFQKGVSVWLVGEAIIYEILGGSNTRRVLNKSANLTLFEILDEDATNS